MCMIIVLHAYFYNVSASLGLILLLKPLKQIIDIPQEHPQFAKMQHWLFWVLRAKETIKQVNVTCFFKLAFFSCGLSIQIPDYLVKIFCSSPRNMFPSVAFFCFIFTFPRIQKNANGSKPPDRSFSPPKLLWTHLMDEKIASPFCIGAFLSVDYFAQTCCCFLLG